MTSKVTPFTEERYPVLEKLHAIKLATWENSTELACILSFEALSYIDLLRTIPSSIRSDSNYFKYDLARLIGGLWNPLIVSGKVLFNFAVSIKTSKWLLEKVNDCPISVLEQLLGDDSEGIRVSYAKRVTISEDARKLLFGDSSEVVVATMASRGDLSLDEVNALVELNLSLVSSALAHNMTVPENIRFLVGLRGQVNG